MRSGFLKRHLVIGSFTLFWLTPLFAQNASLMWIDATGHDTCFSQTPVHDIFGNDINGTYGIDTALGENSPCPPAPVLYGAYWVNIPGRQQSEFGFRCSGRDIRGWSSSAQIDTFNLFFHSICSGPKTFTFRWPDPTQLALRCDSMYLIDTSGQLSKTNMFSRDSVTFVLDSSAYWGNLFIYKYGAKLVDVVTDIKPEQRAQPTIVSLHQNYPNPFNPSTSVSFTISTHTRVRLQVFNLLGQLIETLADEDKPSGTYAVTWEAGTRPSGLYFYRMTAGGYVRTGKAVLLK